MENRMRRQPVAQQPIISGQSDDPNPGPISGQKNILPRILAVLTALSFLTAVLLIGRLHQTLPALMAMNVSDSASDSGIQSGNRAQGWGYLPPVQTGSSKNESAAQGLLVIFADIASPRTSDRIMAAAMADISYGTVIIQAKSDELTSVTLGKILDRVGEFSGIEPSRTAIAAHGDAAIGLIRAWSGVQKDRTHAGLILISPDCRNAGLADLMSKLPREQKLTIIVSNETEAANAGRQLFFVASGEDATMFPGLSGTFELSAERFISIDGQRRLIILPAYSVFNAGWSPRLHQSIQESLETGTPQSPLSTPIKALYDRLLLPSWILLLLAAVPLLLIVNRSLAASPLPHIYMPNRAIELILYLPATALAIPAGRLLAFLAGDERLAEGYAFFALIGFYGWLVLLLSAYRKPADREQAAKSRYNGRTVLLAVAFAILYLAAVLFWMATVFESVLPKGRTGFVLILVAIILLPAMLPATMPFRRSQARQKIFRTLVHLAMPTAYLILIAISLGCASLSDVLFGLTLLITGRVLAKALSFIPAPPIIASAAGSLLILFMWPIPLV